MDTADTVVPPVRENAKVPIPATGITQPQVDINKPPQGFGATGGQDHTFTGTDDLNQGNVPDPNQTMFREEETGARRKRKIFPSDTLNPDLGMDETGIRDHPTGDPRQGVYEHYRSAFDDWNYGNWNAEDLEGRWGVPQQHMQQPRQVPNRYDYRDRLPSQTSASHTSDYTTVHSYKIPKKSKKSKKRNKVIPPAARRAEGLPTALPNQGQPNIRDVEAMQQELVALKGLIQTYKQRLSVTPAGPPPIKRRPDLVDRMAELHIDRGFNPIVDRPAVPKITAFSNPFTVPPPTSWTTYRASALPQTLIAKPRLELADPVASQVQSMAQNAARTATENKKTDLMIEALEKISSRLDQQSDISAILQPLIQQQALEKAKVTQDVELLERAEELKKSYTVSLPYPKDLAVEYRGHPEHMNPKTIRAQISPFNSSADDADFTFTWSRILRYGQGKGFTEMNYVDIILCIVQGKAERELLYLLKCENPLKPMLEMLAQLYTKRRTMMDVSKEIEQFKRSPGESIQTCMCRVQSLLDQLAPMYHGVWEAIRPIMLLNVLKQVIHPSTANYLNGRQITYLKQGTSMSFDTALSEVDTYELSQGKVPTDAAAGIPLNQLSPQLYPIRLFDLPRSAEAVAEDYKFYQSTALKPEMYPIQFCTLMGTGRPPLAGTTLSNEAQLTNSQEYRDLVDKVRELQVAVLETKSDDRSRKRSRDDPNRSYSPKRSRSDERSSQSKMDEVRKFLTAKRTPTHSPDTRQGSSRPSGSNSQFQTARSQPVAKITPMPSPSRSTLWDTNDTSNYRDRSRSRTRTPYRSQSPGIFGDKSPTWSQMFNRPQSRSPMRSRSPLRSRSRDRYRSRSNSHDSRRSSQSPTHINLREATILIKPCRNVQCNIVHFVDEPDCLDVMLAGLEEGEADDVLFDLYDDTTDGSYISEEDSLNE